MAGLSAAAATHPVFAAIECVAPPMQPFLPSMLLLNCASHENFKLFRKYPDAVGLAGVVSMTVAKGAAATYGAGTLLLFPWLKPAGQRLFKSIPAYLPAGAAMAGTTSARTIAGATLPPDEYFCRSVLKAPWQDFIGFSVDAPVPHEKGTSAWRTTIPKLGDGQAVLVDWASANLNGAWFGGSSVIPSGAVCNGGAWRALILRAIDQVAVAAC